MGLVLAAWNGTVKAAGSRALINILTLHLVHNKLATLSHLISSEK